MNPRLNLRLNLSLLAMALGVVAILGPASAQTPDLAAIARASGTPVHGDHGQNCDASGKSWASQRQPLISFAPNAMHLPSIARAACSS